MDSKIYNGDFAIGENGLTETVDGAEELLQRARIRLSAVRGGFVHDPTLGSRLNRLECAPPKAMEEAAMMYVREALADMPQVEPLCVKIETDDGGQPRGVRVGLRLKKEAVQIDI